MASFSGLPPLMRNVRLYAYWRKMPAAMAPKRAMPEPTWKLEAAPVEEAESVEEALGKLASSVELPVAVLREEEVVAVRVAWLMGGGSPEKDAISLQFFVNLFSRMDGRYEGTCAQ